MSKKRNLKIILEEIIQEIHRINRFTEGIENWKDFSENELVYYAVLKCLENIGEATKHIPEEKRKITDFDWRKVTGLRDILIHEYFGIDSEIVWDVVKNKLPELNKAVENLLKEL